MAVPREVAEAIFKELLIEKDMEDKPFYSLDEVARLLGYSRVYTLKRAIKNGVLEGLRAVILHRNDRVYRDSIIEFISYNTEVYGSCAGSDRSKKELRGRRSRSAQTIRL